jgi:hypothetical protein
MTVAVGTEAPDFTLKDQNGQPVTLSDLRGKKNVLLVFFPLAFTGICQGELDEVRDNLPSFDNDETANIYRGTKASFNLYRLETNGNLNDTADGWAMGPREIELAACGTWFARQSRPESDATFPMLPTFASPEELGDQLRWALANPELRHNAAELACRAVADRTFPNNARRLLEAIGH